MKNEEFESAKIIGKVDLKKEGKTTAHRQTSALQEVKTHEGSSH